MKTFFIDRDLEQEKCFADRLFVIGSFPRSGSHWTRRMVAEVVALRNGVSAAFGTSLNQLAGFQHLMSDPLWRETQGPIFHATHSFDHAPKVYRVYLRRRFEDVYRSTLKVESEMGSVWWGGPAEESRAKWEAHIAKGCALADLVIDYEITRTNPAVTVRAICNLAGMNVTDEEVARAVLAGRRDNMLKEQAQNTPRRKWDVVNKGDEK